MSADLPSIIELDAALSAGAAAAALTYVANQKDLAAALGYTGAYVSQLKKAGRIKPEPDGAWCVEAVKQQICDTSDLGQIIAAESRAQNRANPEFVPPSKGQQSDMGIPMSEKLDLPLDDEIDMDDAYGEDHDKNFKIARSFRERELAAQARLNRMKDEGLTVLKADVDRAAYTEARVIRDGVMGYCAKIAPLLASQTDAFEIERMLREGLRQVLMDCVRKDEVIL